MSEPDYLMIEESFLDPLFPIPENYKNGDRPLDILKMSNGTFQLVDIFGNGKYVIASCFSMEAAEAARRLFR